MGWCALSGRKESKTAMNTILFYGIVFCILGAFCGLMVRAFHQVGRQANAQMTPSLPIIVIDAGHGGEDGGSETDSGVLEKDINLAIAQDLQQMLEISGFRVVMTRESDVSIHDSSANTLREKKVSDLHNRLKIMESYADCIVISIHQNHFSQSQYQGAQMFYSTNNEQSKALAESLRTSVTGLLQPDNNRECKPSTSDIYLLHHTQQTAVLVECGFLSNPEEAALLTDDAYQHQMAFAIYCGVLDYWRGASITDETTLP